MILEVCIDSYEAALLAHRYGAKRVELCSGLSVGGLTPSIALTKKCAAIEGIEVHAMLRHREGDFVYTPLEMKLLLEDLIKLSEAQVKGVVFGALPPGNEIDMEQNKALVQAAKLLDLEVTFHRAFDFVENPKKGLETLIDLGFDRLLTSGKQATAIEGLDLIQELVNWSAERIQIMAGSGVNASNALDLATVRVAALHFTSHRLDPKTTALGMGSKSSPDDSKIAAISSLFK